MTKNNKDNQEIFFSSKTDVGLHRQLAEEEGISLKELHEKILSEKANEYLVEIRKEKGIELLTKKELGLMIHALSEMEKDLVNMETSQLLTLIHQGFGRIEGLAASTLLKVKKEESYEIIKKLRRLFVESEDENSKSELSDDPTYSPQLKNKELDELIRGIQDIHNNPETIEEEISKGEITDKERPEPKEFQEEEEEEEEEEKKFLLPEFKIRNSLSTLKLLENLKAASIDDRLGMNFLLEVPRQQIWNSLCEEPEETLIELRKNLKASTGNINHLIQQVLNEYEMVNAMPLPDGYNKNWTNERGEKITKPIKPFLMQRYEAWLIKEKKSRLNLSDAGAGKTLAAVLASQTIKSKFTLIFSPRHVIESWEKTFNNAFPEVEILRQTWEPKWKTDRNKVLIINYERLKTDARTHNQIMNFAKNEEIDFVVLDETHIAKQRGTLETISNETDVESDENISARRKELETLLIELRRKNSEMRIYGLTASPALNDLTEPITLLSLINPGRDVRDMNHIANIPNGLKIHQELTMVSTRWRQSEETKPYKVNRRLIKVDISDKLEDLINDASFRAITQEQHSVDGKMKELRRILSDGKQSIIFVHHVDGIVEKLREKLSYFGYSIGTYYGSDKSGLKPFLNGDNQILIASMSAIGTGFDGLQNICSRAIFFALPWTYEIRKQCEARIARTGQKNDCEFITLEAYYEVNHPKVSSKDKVWSWDKEVGKLIHSKREMSELVVDGQIPSLTSKSLVDKAQEGRMLWIERLKDLGGITYKHSSIKIPIVFKDEIEKKKILGKYGNDFSQINAKWNTSNSDTVFERIKDDPTEWALYQTLYRATRKTWQTYPLKEVIKKIKGLSELVIGDFGCGEGDLAKAIGEESKVLSFDMHAINDSVIPCNIAEGVPIAPNTLDMAIFCLSLMFKDWKKMLLSARKVMKATGQLIVWNPKNKIPEEELKQAIIDAGFQIISTDTSISIEPFIKILAIVDPGSLL
tara:strand:+ start:761 stop:3718 length:2958 start_codon:yes stop_codon:yes gene_type:complete